MEDVSKERAGVVGGCARVLGHLLQHVVVCEEELKIRSEARHDEIGVARANLFCGSAIAHERNNISPEFRKTPFSAQSHSGRNSS